MTMKTAFAALGLAALLITATTAGAQTTPPADKPAAAKPAGDKPAAAAKPARSTKSLECSKQADEKGLHGKERKKFRSDCLKEAKAGAAKSK